MSTSATSDWDPNLLMSLKTLWDLMVTSFNVLCWQMGDVTLEDFLSGCFLTKRKQKTLSNRGSCLSESMYYKMQQMLWCQHSQVDYRGLVSPFLNDLTVLVILWAQISVTKWPHYVKQYKFWVIVSQKHW